MVIHWPGSGPTRQVLFNCPVAREMNETIHAIALLSGGLDSTLALAAIRAQGIEVTALSFSTGFCIVDHHRAMGEHAVKRGKSVRNEALRAGADLAVQVEILDVSREYLPVVAHPRHGYGAGMNPCIDCRIFMFRKAKVYLEEHGAHFVFTGEVLGQRPMSQHRKALEIIEGESGLQGLLLRPLSAKLLPPTIPEQKGWVDREKLYGINGRSRKEQLRLAREFGITDFPQPSGGCCFLPDKVYAARLRDIFTHKLKDSFTLDDVALIKVGRHFRLSPQTKAVVGRHEGENEFLLRFAAGRTLLRVASHPGPTAILDGPVTEAELATAARLAARYSDANEGDTVTLHWERNGDEGELLVEPLPESDIFPFRIGKP